MESTEEKEKRFWEQKYYWCELNIVWYVWSLWCSWTSISIKHPYMGFISGSQSLDLGNGHFSSSQQVECDFKKLPKDTGNKNKKTGKSNNWDEGVKKSLISIFLIRGRIPYEFRNFRLAYSLC